jgi:hypothetical protein
MKLELRLINDEPLSEFKAWMLVAPEGLPELPELGQMLGEQLLEQILKTVITR